jgi:hypothetical protein
MGIHLIWLQHGRTIIGWGKTAESTGVNEAVPGIGLSPSPK